MQLPILSGIYVDNGPDLRTSYPVNMVPVPKKSGISNGFLRPGDGIVGNGSGPGTDRGGIEWRGQCYRVMGTKLCLISNTGAIETLGDVGTGDLVTMDYSFDLLAIASGGRLYYWDGATLVQNVDPDLGLVIDVCWVDGYFMTTDGDSLVVTDLNNPLAVNPLKYGSSEVDPDPVTSLLKIRDEVYAVNRNTIEVFDNIGTQYFPFQRVDGAQITKGCVGVHACCVYLDRIAFLGSGRNESPGVHLGENGQTQKISTQEIDDILLSYTSVQLAGVKLEARNNRSHQLLYVHLPDRTLVYDAAASAELEKQVWFVLTSATVGFSAYRARNFVWCYDRWLVGDPSSNAIGYLVEDVGTHWGQQVRWQFATTITYNDGNGAIFNRLELVALTGRVELGINPVITTQYSLDGVSWSQSKDVRVGTIGNTRSRLVWWRQGHMRNWRIQRFQGTSDAHVSFARLEADLEPLAW
jgi:hypothetical protein